MATFPLGGPNDPRLPKRFPKVNPPGYTDRAPDDTGGGMLLPGKSNGGHRPPPQLPAFMPGQLDALSQQLNQGFGGGLGAWRKNLQGSANPSPLSSFVFGPDPKPKPHGDDKGDDHNGDGHNGDDTGDPGYYDPRDGGFNPHSGAPYLGPSMQMQQPMGQQPMMGQTAQQPMGGQMNPMIMAMLRQRLMGMR